MVGLEPITWRLSTGAPAALNHDDASNDDSNSDVATSKRPNAINHSLVHLVSTCCKGGCSFKTHSNLSIMVQDWITVTGLDSQHFSGLS